jgi:hypothetical protein
VTPMFLEVPRLHNTSSTFRHPSTTATFQHTPDLLTHQTHPSTCLVNVEEALPRAARRSQRPGPQPPRPPQAASANPRLLLILPSKQPRYSSRLRLPHPRDQVCSARWHQPLRKSAFPLPQISTIRHSTSTHKTNTHPSGVAVGSSIGHAVGGWFGGGSSAPAEASPQQTTEFAGQHQDTTSAQMQQSSSGACATDVNNFRKCMDENQGSLTICGWYLDQLKACQSAASQY